MVPGHGGDVRAQRLVLRTQSRSVRLWSAAVSSEDQPQRGEIRRGPGMIPWRGGNGCPAATGAFRTQSRSARLWSAAVCEASAALSILTSSRTPGATGSVDNVGRNL